MKILLVNPRYNEPDYRYKVNKLVPPQGLGYLASVLLEEGHSVAILDMEALQIEWSDLPVYLNGTRPDVVGIHATTPVSPFITRCATIVKDHCPDATVVVGGPHATLLPAEVLTTVPQVDYVLRGEAELTMRSLVRHLADEGPVTDVDAIPGIGFRNCTGPIISRQVPRIDDLDALPLPAYDLLPMEAYYETGTEGRVCSIMSTRGCPYSCVYCSAPVLYGHKYRCRSAQTIAREMQVLSSQHGAEHVIFYDAAFAIDRTRVERLCHEIGKSALPLTWRVRIRADSVNEPVLRAMKGAGCVSLSIGVETASQRLLDALNKRCTIRDITDAFRMAKELGFRTVGYFMFGIPGETRQEAYATIEFAKRLDPDWALFSVATPLPGTALFDAVKDRITTRDWSRFKFNTNTPAVSCNGMSTGELSALVDHAYQSFYLRDEWLAKRLEQAASAAEKRRILDSYHYYLDKSRLS